MRYFIFLILLVPSISFANPLMWYQLMGGGEDGGVPWGTQSCAVNCYEDKNCTLYESPCVVIEASSISAWDNDRCSPDRNNYLDGSYAGSAGCSNELFTYYQSTDSGGDDYNSGSPCTVGTPRNWYQTDE